MDVVPAIILAVVCATFGFLIAAILASSGRADRAATSHPVYLCSVCEEDEGEYAVCSDCLERAENDYRLFGGGS